MRIITHSMHGVELMLGCTPACVMVPAAAQAVCCVGIHQGSHVLHEHGLMSFQDWCAY
jgi:hypothetical protein